MRRSEQIDIFVQEIWSWYARHKRTLPWRDLDIKDDTQRAYMIMVSEIMLQQTRVSRVIIKYKEFLSTFPTLASLASASNRDVIMSWRGMGYNNRALRLRDCAQHIQDQQNHFPTAMSDLQSLPGIGHYTAAAIRNFAFHIPTPCIDTNIRRILHRTFVGPEHPDGTWKKDDAYVLEIAQQALDVAIGSDSSYTCADWHAALMDFGSLVCTKRDPKWDICPLTKSGICKAAYKVKPLQKSSTKKEPGRYVGSTYIPNRIFRGKVVEALRDNPTGMSTDILGKEICIDWSSAEHKKWLTGIIHALIKDQIVQEKQGKYVLSS